MFQTVINTLLQEAFFGSASLLVELIGFVVGEPVLEEL